MDIGSIPVSASTTVPYENDYLQYYGGMPERSKGADCKSAGSAFEGSNPSPTTTEGLYSVIM